MVTQEIVRQKTRKVIKNYRMFINRVLHKIIGPMASLIYVI